MLYTSEHKLKMEEEEEEKKDRINHSRVN